MTWQKALAAIAISAIVAGLPAATATAAGPYVPYGAIAAEWQAKGGASGFLGAPTSAEYDVPGVPDARVEEFAGGQILWSADTGAHEVHGAILGEYFGAAAGPVGIGLPTTDEVTTPDRIGRFNHFAAGSIYWTPATGAHAVHGGIRVNWAAGGWERGPLGYPTSDEFDVTGTPVELGHARGQDFVKGREFWSPVTDAHEVHGAILAEYAALGGPPSFVGLPLTNETTTPDGVGRYNHFSGHASIYWTPATGAHEVHGGIRDTWAASGWERGALGYPVTDEIADGPDIRLSSFQHGFITYQNGVASIHLV